MNAADRVILEQWLRSPTLPQACARWCVVWRRRRRRTRVRVGWRRKRASISILRSVSWLCVDREEPDPNAQPQPPNLPLRPRAYAHDPRRRAKRNDELVRDTRGGLGADSSASLCRKAPSDRPALKPYGGNRPYGIFGGRWTCWHQSKTGPRRRSTRQMLSSGSGEGMDTDTIFHGVDRVALDDSAPCFSKGMQLRSEAGGTGYLFGGDRELATPSGTKCSSRSRGRRRANRPARTSRSVPCRSPSGRRPRAGCDWLGRAPSAHRPSSACPATSRTG